MGVFKGFLMPEPPDVLLVPSKVLRAGMLVLEVVRKLKSCPYGRTNTQQHNLLVLSETLVVFKHLSLLRVDKLELSNSLKM